MAQIMLRDYLQETEDAISSKRVDEALASCQYILAYFPESLEAQRLLGEVYLAQGRLEDARNAFDWVLTNDPENVVAYCSRALVSERMSDYDTALDCYQQAYELSRGNSQIRQAFNQLSAKAGQPGFMFSRAGLARLYMRGNLLAQSIQEWNIVLTVTPDRLDARTGLLEAYWRQGLNDRASQLAEQILQDVPGCVKALLLLAHVMAPQNMLRSRDLIQRVSSLDPDFQMAHDLFADHIASQPNDPFLKLFDRPGATLGEPDRSASSAADTSNATHTTAQLQNGDAASVAQWGGDENWNNEVTLLKSGSATSETADTALAGSASLPSSSAALPTEQAKPSTPAWMSDDAFNIGRRYGGEKDVPAASSVPGPGPSSAGQAGSASSQSALPWSQYPWNVSEQEAPAPEFAQSGVWQLPEHAVDDKQPAPTSSDAGLGSHTSTLPPSHADEDQPPSAIAQPPAASPRDRGSNWDLNLPPFGSQSAATHDQQLPPASLSASLSGLSGPASSSQSWPPVQSEPDNAPAPPPWLSMLKQSEPARPSSPLPAVPVPSPIPDELAPTAQVEPPLAAQPPVAPVDEPKKDIDAAPVQTQPEPSLDVDNADLVADIDETDDADEDSFFGPAWLRSLGAMDEPGAEPAVTAPTAESASAASIPDDVPDIDEVASQLPAASVSEPEPEPEQPAPSVSVAPPVEEEPPLAQSSHSASWMDWQTTLENASTTPATNAWWQESVQQYDPFAGTGKRSVDQPAAGLPASEPAPAVASEIEDAPTAQVPDDAPALSSPQSPVHEVQTPVSLESQDVPVDDPWAKLSQQLQDKSIDYAWLEQLAGGHQSPAPVDEPAAIAHEEVAPVAEPPQTVAQPSPEQSEQHVITTLEELDQRLRSRGFITLEPNSLATIAQSTESSEITESTEPVLPDEEPPVVEADAAVEEPLPTEDEPQPEPERTEEIAAPSTKAEPYSAFAELSTTFQSQRAAEPSWLSALSAASSPAPMVQATPPSVLPVPQPEVEIVPESPARVPSPLPQEPAAQAQPPVLPPPAAPVPANPVPQQAIPQAVPFEQEPVSPLEETQTLPVARSNPFSDNELETTMKRPAVRLQPMKPRMMAQTLHVTPPIYEAHGQGRPVHNKGQHSHADVEENVGYRERLVHGYQAQLVGDYDSAMQEYRIIIRNAPELLSEVVSNVRALLKLAPKYSAGYRVLGDAYMRQGEYLQAMEAYNKALTMAKKARN